MIFPTLFENIQSNSSPFDCVSSKNELRVKSTTSERLGYMISYDFSSESIRTFDYVHALYAPHDIAFAPNQSIIIKLSTEMFSDSRSLNALESDILDLTFGQMVKTKPTLQGRK